jgi:hypothetical protein
MGKILGGVSWKFYSEFILPPSSCKSMFMLKVSCVHGVSSTIMITTIVGFKFLSVRTGRHATNVYRNLFSWIFLSYHLQSTEMQKIWITIQFAYTFLQIPFAGRMCSLSPSCAISIHGCMCVLLFSSFYVHPS